MRTAPRRGRIRRSTRVGCAFRARSAIDSFCARCTRVAAARRPGEKTSFAPIPLGSVAQRESTPLPRAVVGSAFSGSPHARNAFPPPRGWGPSIPAAAAIHGVPIEKIHLNEVGAVDAILDVVGAIWGLSELGVEEVRCGVLRTGDGTVLAAHGALPVPAPATLKLLEGLSTSPGPEGSGELVTPTGAALVRVLSAGPPPAIYTPIRSGFGAGTKDFADRANALRIILAETQSHGTHEREQVVMLACDIDDMSPEYLAGVAERARADGALDVVLIPVLMKKGRAGTRLDVLARPIDADRLEQLLLTESNTIGVRRSDVTRRVLLPRTSTVDVLGHVVGVKFVTLPDGGLRAKPEFDDVNRVALATGRRAADIYQLALAAAERR